MASRPTKKSGFSDLLRASNQPTAAGGINGSGRRMKEGYTQVGANIPAELKKKVFRMLPDAGINFSQLCEDLLDGWVDGKFKLR